MKLSKFLKIERYKRALTQKEMANLIGVNRATYVSYERDLYRDHGTRKIYPGLKPIQKIASKLANEKDVFFIGRNIDYATCMEGSLKLKEISYISSVAYAAGELKHGTISLIENKTNVIGVITREDIFEKTISNLVEVKSRGAYVTTIIPEDKEVGDVANQIIKVPVIHKYLYPSLTVIPLQLLSYYVSVAKGLDVDKPRNLAKSVTVE